MVNILNNVIKYSRLKGRIKIDASRVSNLRPLLLWKRPRVLLISFITSVLPLCVKRHKFFIHFSFRSIPAWGAVSFIVLL